MTVRGWMIVIMKDKTTQLKRCPCGTVPTALGTSDTGQGGKYANTYGICCGDWEVEFRTNYHSVNSSEYQDLAIKAWNNATRCFDENSS